MKGEKRLTILMTNASVPKRVPLEHVLKVDFNDNHKRAQGVWF